MASRSDALRAGRQRGVLAQAGRRNSHWNPAAKSGKGQGMKAAVLVFPGSNCDYDSYAAVKFVLGQPAEFLWHKSESLAGCDVIILPGGFAYGDYLRSGAIARFSPIMKSVISFAKSGGIVIGISWARRKSGNPVSKELLIKSLKQRLESGELSKQEYEKKLSELPK